MKTIIYKHPVVIFFMLTLVLSSLAWIWLMPIQENFFWIGECAPGFSALLLTWVLNGKRGVVTLLKPALRWRANPYYYFIIIFGLAFFYLVAVEVSILQGAHPPAFFILYNEIKTPFFNLSAIWLMPELCILYIFCEELGWRGFALTKLLTKFSVFNASLIVGFMWALFHVPLMLNNASKITLPYLIGYIFSTLLSSFLFSWIYLKTNRSLFTVGLLHSLIDTYGAFSPTIISEVGQGKNYTTIFLYCIILLPLIIYIYKNDKILRSTKSYLYSLHV